MMMKTLLQAGAVAVMALYASDPARAAVLAFDLSGLEDSFGLASPVAGGFTLDTDTLAFTAITIATDLDDYSTASASALKGAGFGLPDDFFVFETSKTTFFFGIDPFSPGSPGLAVGQTQIFGNVLALEGEEVNEDFQIEFGGAFALYFGDVAVTRLSDPVAAIPLPASLPFLITGLAGMGLLTFRRRRAVT